MCWLQSPSFIYILPTSSHYKAELSFYRDCSHGFALLLRAAPITGRWLNLILPLGLQSETIYYLVLYRSLLTLMKSVKGTKG